MCFDSYIMGERIPRKKIVYWLGPIYVIYVCSVRTLKEMV